ncbi:MAG: hypothetical protein EOP00_11100 [Pedobacter sp.]|nr:MAG: hypothetical protein EOP00_11100 [Pedobacter sp.]
MNWDLIKGVEPKPEIPIKRCLRLDGVNDYLTLGDNPFYNTGNGAFSFAFSFLKFTDKASTAIYRSANDGAGSGITGLVSRITINLESSHIIRLNLINNENDVDKFDILAYNLTSAIIGNWVNVVVIRNGTNISDNTNVILWPDSVRNPNNIHLYLNGVKLTPDSISMSSPEGLFYNFDNTKEKILGGVTNLSTYYLKGYYSLFGFWNRVLSLSEINNINNGVLDDFQAKGIFIFDGNTADSSSVGGVMTLINSATPSHITYPKKAGVIPFAKTTANQIKTFSYPSTVTVTKIWKEQSGYNGFQYSLNAGTTWMTIPDGELVTVSIVVPFGSSLQIKDPTSRTNYNVLHLDFN